MFSVLISVWLNPLCTNCGRGYLQMLTGISMCQWWCPPKAYTSVHCSCHPWQKTTFQLCPFINTDWYCKEMFTMYIVTVSNTTKLQLSRHDKVCTGWWRHTTKWLSQRSWISRLVSSTKLQAQVTYHKSRNTEHKIISLFRLTLFVFIIIRL